MIQYFTYNTVKTIFIYKLFSSLNYRNDIFEMYYQLTTTCFENAK